MDCLVLDVQKINDHQKRNKQKFVHDSTFFLFIYHEVYKLHIVTTHIKSEINTQNA